MSLRGRRSCIGLTQRLVRSLLSHLIKLAVNNLTGPDFSGRGIITDPSQSLRAAFTSAVGFVWSAIKTYFTAFFSLFSIAFHAALFANQKAATQVT